jgi:hypothetical protein
MSEHPLATYLHDHLAGASGATELLEALSDHHTTAPFGAFADSLLTEIQEDRAILESLAEGLGGGGKVLKEAAAWVGHKGSHLKLGHLAKSKLGTFEAQHDAVEDRRLPAAKDLLQPVG